MKTQILRYDEEYVKLYDLPIGYVMGLTAERPAD
jgi:hypothetical protein